ncbi:MAG: zinc ribbon domain-containing protein [Pseudomonadales bacterium]
MPIYEYQCGSCGHQMDKLQGISDAPLTDCPACEKPELKKVISAGGFRLKGAGWYETDFKAGSSGSQGSSKNAGCGSGSCKTAAS